MTLEQLRQEYNFAKSKYLTPSKEFRALEEKFYFKFLEILKDSTEISDGVGLCLPEFKARDHLKLLDLTGDIKTAYDLGWRGASFYFL